MFLCAVAAEEQYDSAVVDLMDLGYPHNDVIRAMRASFNNPDRAAEFLLSVRSVLFVCLFVLLCCGVHSVFVYTVVLRV